MTQTTLSLAKTTQPTLSIVLNREHLFQKIDSSDSNRAIWLSGPPGSGKTTLVASYLNRTPGKVLWYQLDSSDADIATFFFYLRQSAIKHSKNSTHDIPELPSVVTNWTTFGRRLFREIFVRFNGPLIIVFDNYEAIPPHSELHRMFAEIVEEVPLHSRLIFAGRLGPVPAFARVRASDAILLIDGDDLKLTFEECEQLAKLRNVKVNKELLPDIYHASTGWLTGTILMLEHIRQSGNNDGSTYTMPGDVLYDYMAEEIFLGFDQSTREFLIKICWSRRLSIRLAEKISGDRNARQLLTNLSRNNYFVSERDDSKECEYILHPLLREFLQSQSLKSSNGTTISDLQKKTAFALVQEGQMEEAVEILAANLCWEPLEQLITENAGLLIQQGRSGLLVTWLEELPLDRLNSDGWLLYWFGKARLFYSPREARNYFELAFRNLQNESDQRLNGNLLACCGAIEAILAEMDDYTLLDQWIAELKTLLQANTPIKDDSDSINAQVMLLTAEVIRSPTQEIKARYRQVEQLLRSRQSNQELSRYGLWLILGYQLTGDFERAENLVNWLQSCITGNNAGPAKCEFILLKALNNVFSGHGEIAIEQATEGETLAKELTSTGMLPFLFACASSAAITLNDLESAKAWLNKIESSPGHQRRMTRFLYYYLGSWIALVGNDILNAHHLQRQAQACAIELGVPFLEVLSGSAYAQLLFLCDDKRAGTAQLRRVHSVASDVGNPLLEFMTLLIFAEVELEGGRNASAINAMRYSLGLGRQHGYYQLPWWRPQQLADMCVQAMNHKIEVEYVRDLVVHNGLQPTLSPVDIPDWPWLLRITTFTGLCITQQGNTHGVPEKGKGRPVHLLEVLIALGPKNVAAEEAANILWPHVDSDYSIKSLTINLHRLRRLLGNDDSVLLSDGRLSLNDNLVWLDGWALESLVGKIEEIVVDSENVNLLDDVTNLGDRLLEIYRGEFLPKDDKTACIVKAREKYRTLFVRGIKLISGVMHSLDASNRAVELYETAMQCDPQANASYEAADQHGVINLS